MKLEELKKEVESENKSYKGICHDCGCHVEISVVVNEKGGITISGGALYKIKQGYHEEIFFKCDACFRDDKSLRDFRQCEVYSRAIGYLRPVNQWNIGKREEFKMRKNFTNTKGK